MSRYSGSRSASRDSGRSSTSARTAATASDFGAAERGRFERDAGGAADALAVDVDERASGVEEDGSDALHPQSSDRTTASSSSAMAWTSLPSGPSTRIRRSGSVPE